jgi:3-oxoacyl-[acyl-carrier protein] reductase
MGDTPTRTAIVTGGARGIDAAVAARLAADGMAVGVLDLDEAGAKSTAGTIAVAGGGAVGVAADVAEPGSVRAAVDRVATELAPPAVVVNNAGVTRAHLVSFLVSEGAGFVSGQVIYAAGGPRD